MISAKQLLGWLLSVRYISLLAIVASVAGTILMFIIGTTKIVKAWLVFVPDGFAHEAEKAPEANAAIAYVAQGIDCFLIALVMLVFASGIFNIAILNKEDRVEEAAGLFNVNTIGELKQSLGELVGVILFVKFLEVSLSSADKMTWEALILPGGAILLAVALKVLNLRGRDEGKPPEAPR